MTDFNRGYSPAEAERGKFTCLTNADLSSLGMTITGSYGRYAILTYDVGSLSNLTCSVAVSIPNATEVASITIANSGAVSAISLTNYSKTIEIRNISDNTIYLYWTATTYPIITSMGMPLDLDTFYSIDRRTKGIWIASAGDNADVRIFSHYNI